MFTKYSKLFFNFSVRVRYAPSPTGPMHIGAVRTALFNYLFAKHNNGKFIVRIEDTDQVENHKFEERNVEGSCDEILDTLDWLGITPDESIRKEGNFGPYVQSERLNLYKKVQLELLRKGFAYPCFCGSEEHIKKNNKSKEKVESETGYNGKCRKLTVEEVKSKIENGEKYAIRLKSDIKELKDSKFKDEIYGEVTSTPFSDFVIVKSNGVPTYHFANVIDDWKMGITHVIRGFEWLTNTPKHIYLYKILEAKVPIFMHLPLIIGPDGKKLSKRDPTAPVNNLKRMGYLPEALINYTGLMGYNRKENSIGEEESGKSGEEKKANEKELKDEFLSIGELIEEFEITKVKNTPIKSNPKKLNFFNRHYFRKNWKENEQYQEEIISNIIETFSKPHENYPFSKTYVRTVIDFIIDRVNNLQELKEEYHYFFQHPTILLFNMKDVKLICGESSSIESNKGSAPALFNTNEASIEKLNKVLHNLRLIFEHILSPEDIKSTKIAESISQFLFDNKEIANEDVYNILRLALTGKKSGANILRTCEIFGIERIKENLKQFYLFANPSERFGDKN